MVNQRLITQLSTVATLITMVLVISMIPLVLIELVITIALPAYTTMKMLEAMCLTCSLLQCIVPVNLVLKMLATRQEDRATTNIMMGYSLGSIVSLAYAVRANIFPLIINSGVGLALQLAWLILTLAIAIINRAGDSYKTRLLDPDVLKIWVFFIGVIIVYNVVFFLLPLKAMGVIYLLAGAISQLGFIVSLPEAINEKRNKEKLRLVEMPQQNVLAPANLLFFFRSSWSAKVNLMHLGLDRVKSAIISGVDYSVLLNLLFVTNLLWFCYSYLNIDEILYWSCMIGHLVTAVQWLAYMTPILAVGNHTFCDFELLFRVNSPELPPVLEVPV